MNDLSSIDEKDRDNLRKTAPSLPSLVDREMVSLFLKGYSIDEIGARLSLTAFEVRKTLGELVEILRGKPTKKQLIKEWEAFNINEEMMRFGGERLLPTWLVVLYMCGHATLQVLNVFWFGKMLAAVKKRFVGTEKKKQ